MLVQCRFGTLPDQTHQGAFVKRSNDQSYVFFLGCASAHAEREMSKPEIVIYTHYDIC